MRAALILAACVACSLLGGKVTPRPSPPKAAWEKELKEIAAAYTQYGRIDRLIRWAPEDCRAPAVPTMRLSHSQDTATHGQKLYTIFAKQKTWDDASFDRRQTYLPPYLKDGVSTGRKRGLAPVGQVIVKESWVPVAVTDEEKRADPQAYPYRSGKGITSTMPGPGEHFGLLDYGTEIVPYAYNSKEQKYYKADKKADLFIMFKVDPQTPETDQGWVYGTVTADGQKVTAMGKIASCMNCHQQAPHDRLFGLKE